jgi:glucose/arabinose dehydrogenase
MHFLRNLTILALVVAAGCGGSSNTNPPSSPPPATGGDTITGRERIGWVQQADASDLPFLDYFLYVDGARRELDDTCTPTNTGNSYECSAALPPLTAGTHTLELAASFTNAAGVEVEGPRSAALRVTVAGAVASAEGFAGEGSFVSTDGLPITARLMARSLSDPVDLAVAPDGRVFVAERGGRVLSVHPDDPDAPVTAMTGADLARMARGADAALASIALAPDFDESGVVHLASVTAGGEGSILEVSRLREVGGRFGEAAGVVRRPVPSEAPVVARFGPDDALYLGIGTGADPGSAQTLASDGGKILKVLADGTTPDGMPWDSPVFSVGHHDPRGLAWHPSDQAMWEVERDEQGDELNTIRAGANYGWPTARGTVRHPSVTPPILSLPEGSEPSGIAIVSAPGSPVLGDLIISALGGADLFRLRIDGQGRRTLAGRLLQGRFGRIAQIAAGADGSLYVITANSDRWGPGNDVLIKLTTPSTRRPSRR